jgi:hypothetical protein
MDDAADSSPSRVHPALLAAGFLFPIDRLRQPDSPLWRSAGRWLVPWGFLIGLVYLATFRGAWKWFGEYWGVRWLPAVTVLAIDLGFCGHRLLAGVTELPSRLQTARSERIEALTLGVLVAVLLITIAKYAMLVSLPLGVFTSPPTPGWYLPRWIRFLCPDDEIYRPLMLMPIWGRWAIGLAASIGRVSPSEPDRVQQMAAGLTLRTIFSQWAGITLITMAYCALVIDFDRFNNVFIVFIPSSRTLAYGLVVSLAVMLGSYLASFLLARLKDGQTESSVLVAGMTAELTFLTVYLHLASLIYRY